MPYLRSYLEVKMILTDEQSKEFELMANAELRGGGL